MRFPKWLTVFGDKSYRGDCPREAAEQVTFIQWLRRTYPDTLGAIAVHVRNEGKRTHGQAWHQKAEGMTAGAPDVIIPMSPPVLIELKRRDHTKSRWQKGQQEYLKAAQDAGAFVCVALGADAAIEALRAYLDERK